MFAQPRDNTFFSKEGYIHIINSALDAGYTSTTFRNALDAPEKAIILRHDIDLSLKKALELATLEAELGVQGTYFIMVTNDYYSPFNQIGRQQVKDIEALGHEIGLHWDSSNYPDDISAVESQFKNELALLGDVVGHKIHSAAQHIPTDSPIFDVESFVNVEAYAQVYRDRFTYVSDSSMKWRDKTPLDLIDSGVDIHFCSHPIWWVTPGANQGEKLRASLDVRSKEMTDQNEAFIAYIDEFLKERAKHDQYFIDKKGAMNA